MGKLEAPSITVDTAWGPLAANSHEDAFFQFPGLLARNQFIEVEGVPEGEVLAAQVETRGMVRLIRINAGSRDLPPRAFPLKLSRHLSE